MLRSSELTFYCKYFQYRRATPTPRCSAVNTSAASPPPEVQSHEPKCGKVQNNNSFEESEFINEHTSSACVGLEVPFWKEYRTPEIADPYNGFPRSFETQSSFLTESIAARYDEADSSGAMMEIPWGTQGARTGIPSESGGSSVHPLSFSVLKTERCPGKKTVSSAEKSTRPCKRKEAIFRLKKALQELQSFTEVSEIRKKPDARKPKHRFCRDRHHKTTGEITFDGRPISFWVLPIRDRT